MLKEDLETMGVDWSDVRDTAIDRARWRQLVARCSTWNGRNYVIGVGDGGRQGATAGKNYFFRAKIV